MNMTMPVVEASVEVPVDPAEAFRLYTDGIESWWRKGTIYWNDSERAVGIRFEHGVGGRFIEVYDAVTGDGFEIGRIQIWEPGKHLAYSWREAGWAAGETTTVDVTFSSIETGTRVSLRHSGWESITDGAEQAGNYSYGSKELMGWFAEAATA
jgi:uncharacterized protein YndB with AHSA1/START domain